jgi:UDP-N-acetylmuramyl pentapeptide synthase
MKNTFRRLAAVFLEFQTRRLMSRRTFKVVGVSGAVGKTTTKLAIATVLSQKYKVLVQRGSFNDEIGLPLACFNVELPGHILNPFSWLRILFQMEMRLHQPYPYDILVIEIGTDAPGEIPHTLTYVKPDIGVVTAVTPEHMEFFKTLDAVAKEELALAGGSTQVVTNGEDIEAKYRHKYLDHHPAHFTYGLLAKNDYSFRVAETSLINGTTGALLKNGHATVVGITTGLHGAHSAKAAAAAYAVGDLMDLSKKQLEDGVQAIRPVSGRMNPLPGLNGSTIIDDTYNSSPEAALAALKALEETSATRRIAIMGSMNELGADSPRYHIEVGAAYAGVDLLVTVGELANTHLGPAAVSAGLDPTRWQAADSPHAAGEYLKLLLQPGDVVLAKGSQNGVFAEEAVKLLLADPADIAKLVRQSPAWQRTKDAQFPDGAV